MSTKARDQRGTDRAGELVARLKAAGLRATKPRVAVFAQLSGDGHATAEELGAAVASEGVAPSTVYRILESLQRAGLVREVSLAAGRRSYHLAQSAAHVHLRCSACGDIQDADVERLAPLARHLDDAYGFGLDVAHPVLTGLCRRCR